MIVRGGGALGISRISGFPGFRYFRVIVMEKEYVDRMHRKLIR